MIASFIARSISSSQFLWCLPKETVSSRQRKALFYPGGSTIRVSAAGRWTIRSSPDLGEGAGGYLSPYLRRGRTGPVMAALRGKSTARASLSLSGSAYRQKRVSLGLHPVSLRKSKEMGWIHKTSAVYHPIKRRTRTRCTSMRTLSFALRAAGRG